jgi:type IV pilus assembly protein PilM
MALFDGISQFLSSFAGSKGGSVVGIDIGSASIKVVQLKEVKGTAVLETYGEMALGPYAQMPVGKATRLSNESTTEALLSLMKEANVTATVAGVAIPFSSSLVSVIQVPETDTETMKRMIPLEARKYIPVPVSEVMLDWFIIPKDQTTDAFDPVNPAQPTAGSATAVDVLLVAIHNETLERYQAIMKGANLTTKFFEIESFSSIRSALPQTTAPMALIDIGATNSKIYVIEKGVPRITHLVNFGSQNISETLVRTMNWSYEKAERVKRESGLYHIPTLTQEENNQLQIVMLSTLERIYSEANRVLLSYGKRYNKNIAKMILMGGGSALLGIGDTASKALGMEVEAAHPFIRTQSPAFLETTLRQIGPGFAVAVGAALRALSNK